MAAPDLEEPRLVAALSACRLVEEGVVSLAKRTFGSGTEVQFHRDMASLASLAGPPDLLLLLGTDMIEQSLPKLAGLPLETTKIVVFCDSATPQAIQSYLANGIIGIVHSCDGKESFSDALRFVWKGGRFVSSGFWVRPQAGTSFFDMSSEEKILDDHEKATLALGGVAANGRLTPRQRAVVDLVRSGASNKEIARRLSISESTVKTHLHLIMRMVGAPSRKTLTAVNFADIA